MPWIELHVKTNADYADQMSDQLTLLGAHAVTFQDAGDQPIYEPTPGSVNFWHETSVIGLFDHTLQLKPILIYLEQLQNDTLIKNFAIKHVEDQEWERVCLEHFKPIQCGKRLWICPSWETPPDPNAVNVTLDPGLAFGTGTHPTTSLCLSWLDANLSDQPCVIDYGCGSGILGISAVKLGAEHVYAVDNDPQALEATQQNALRNSLEINTYLPNDILRLSPKADLLIANILAKPLIDLAPTFASLLKTKGKILLSGILIEQIGMIKEAYHPWFLLDESGTKGDWVYLAGKKR
jgi:ribosomal protein L11 methyltransferase